MYIYIYKKKSTPPLSRPLHPFQRDEPPLAFQKRIIDLRGRHRGSPQGYSSLPSPPVDAPNRCEGHCAHPSLKLLQNALHIIVVEDPTLPLNLSSVSETSPVIARVHPLEKVGRGLLLRTKTRKNMVRWNHVWAAAPAAAAAAGNSFVYGIHWPNESCAG